METPEQRRARLVAHAASMRQSRAGKKAASTVVREHPLPLQLQRTARLLSRLAPANMAPMPIAMALEAETWTVDLHIRTIETEYESTGEARSLENAIATARKGLLKAIAEDDSAKEGANP